jgi:hypothetical protein
VFYQVLHLIMEESITRPTDVSNKDRQEMFQAMQNMFQINCHRATTILFKSIIR